MREQPRGGLLGNPALVERRGEPLDPRREPVGPALQTAR
jgi:hypothetical protein